MNNGDGAFEQALRVLRRRKLVILIAVISVPLAAFFVSASKTKQYTATATLLFESKAEEATGEATRAVATNEALAVLPSVASKAAKALGGPSSIGEIYGHVEVTAANEMANVGSVSATNESPTRAAEIANAYSLAYIRFRQESSQKSLEESIEVISAKLDAIPGPERTTARAIALSEELSKLEVEAALATGKASLVQKAEPPANPS